MDTYYKLNAIMPFTITARDIDDLMCLAYWWGRSKWCDDIACPHGYSNDFAYRQIAKGGTLLFHEAAKDRWHTLTFGKLLDGITRYLVLYGCVPRKDPISAAADHAIVWNGRFCAGNLTEEIADRIIQVAIFGCAVA